MSIATKESVVSSKSRTRPRIAVREILAFRHAELASAWIEAWQSRDDHTPCSSAEESLLRSWSDRLFMEASFALAGDHVFGDGDKDLASELVANVSLPVAMNAAVHLSRWFESYLHDVLHYHLSTGERRVFHAVVDAAITGMARTTEVEREQRTLFLDMLAHDLRAPLGAILFMTSTVVRSGLVDDRLRMLFRVEQSAHRMKRMIEELLTFARARTSQPLVRELVTLDNLCRAIAEETSAAHGGRLVSISSVGDTEGHWDAERLGQVVQNLIDNAMFHSPEGSGVRVTICGEEMVRLSVNNIGEPIPPEKLPGIFEPYRRAAGNGNPRGLGLGLYIVKEFVRAHGGSVEVRSTEEEGTTFTIVLPRRAMSPDESGMLRRAGHAG